MALEESGEGSDGEWEEVTYATSITAVDQPLIAAPSGFTLPARGKRSEFLTLEVIEDWQPTQEPTSAQDDFLEADLQLERELAQGLADLNTPAPSPPRQLRSHTPDVANVAPSPQPPVHPKLEVIGQRSSARMSAKGKGKMVDTQPAERLHKTGKRADPPRVSLAIEDPPTRKPTVSFKAKASELARSAGRLLTASKPLPSRNIAALPSLSTTGGPSPTPNNPPHPCTQAISDLPGPTPQLFTPKGFSHHSQKLRAKTAEDTLRRFHERYGGETMGRAGRELVGATSASKGTQPTQRRKAQGKAGGKRVSKAQAQAEEVTKICRSTKSYIVDMAAIRRRQASTLPGPQHPTTTTTPPSARPPCIRPEERVPVIAGQRVSKTQPQVPLPVSQLLSASFGSVPRGLKFTRKQKLAPEPGEITLETVGSVSSERDVREPRFAAASGGNGPLTMGVSKRRREMSGRESEGSSPRKKPRLGRS